MRVGWELPVDLSEDEWREDSVADIFREPPTPAHFIISLMAVRAVAKASSMMVRF
jgi:hypothetical protein